MAPKKKFVRKVANVGRRGTYARQKAVGRTEAQHRESLLDAIAEWGIPRDDPDATDVAGRYAKAWGQLPSAQQGQLLRTAEEIARAEQAKLGWIATTAGPRYEHLAETAIQAARLADNLAGMFPKPWDDGGSTIGHLLAQSEPRDDGRLAIGHLIVQLDGFVDAACDANVLDRDLAVFVASQFIDRTRAGAKKPGREMIRNLAWLASHKKHFLDESTIRRYSRTGRPTHAPGFRVWKDNWALVRRVAKLTRERRDQDHAEPFRPAVRVYLDA